MTRYKSIDGLLQANVFLKDDFKFECSRSSPAFPLTLELKRRICKVYYKKPTKIFPNNTILLLISCAPLTNSVTLDLLSMFCIDFISLDTHTVVFCCQNFDH